VRIGLADGRPGETVQLGDLTEGTSVVLQLSVDRRRVLSVTVFGPTVFGKVKGVDATNRTITLTVKEDGMLVEKTYDVGKEVPVKLGDVGEGKFVSLRLSLDQKRVVAISVHKE
jgi:hypothetical protein